MLNLHCQYPLHFYDAIIITITSVNRLSFLVFTFIPSVEFQDYFLKIFESVKRKSVVGLMYADCSTINGPKLGKHVLCLQ